MKNLILVLTMLVAGCTWPTKPDPVIDTVKKVNIDGANLQPCSRLPETINIVSFDDLVTIYGGLATQYAICAKKHQSNIVLIKKLGNINE